MTVEVRSWLFVPGADERKLAKGVDSGADALIYDLEDAVVPERRPAARELIRAALDAAAGGPQRWVRINPLDTADALPDLAAVVGPGLDGVMLPKITGGADVRALDHYLSALETRAGVGVGTIGIHPIATETPEVLFRLGELVGASARVRAVTWGAEDLATALGATSNKDANGDWDDPYRLARSLCLAAARSIDAQPVDTLYGAFDDDDGLAASVRSGARQGFTGKLAIHPRQVAIINELLTPSAEAIAEAKAVIAAFAAQPDAGAVSLDGRMLDRPHLVQAERLLARAGA